MQNVEAVGKDRRNQMQGYNFRGIDDLYNMLHEALSKIGVFSVPFVLEDRTEERTTAKGGLLIYRVLKIKYTFYAEDGSSIESIVLGEAMDSGDKGSNKAMSVAHKYALLQIFAIPTSDPKDVENENPTPIAAAKKHDHSVNSVNPTVQKQTPKFDKSVKNCIDGLRKFLVSKNLEDHFDAFLEKAHGREMKPGWLEQLLA